MRDATDCLQIVIRKYCLSHFLTISAFDFFSYRHNFAGVEYVNKWFLIILQNIFLVNLKEVRIARIETKSNYYKKT